MHPHELRLQINLSTIQRSCRDSRVVQDTRWKDFAASGDEYHFISTRTCELTSEWQGGGPRKTRRYGRGRVETLEKRRVIAHEISHFAHPEPGSEVTFGGFGDRTFYFSRVTGSALALTTDGFAKDAKIQEFPKVSRRPRPYIRGC